jgi:hypothetical protein
MQRTISDIRYATRGGSQMIRRIAQSMSFFVIIIAACSTPPPPPASPVFAVEVSSLLDPSSGGKRSYALFPGVEGIGDTDLQYREFARYIRKILSVREFVEVQDPAEAEIAIFVNYGIGKPQTTHFSYSFPVFGMTGGGTSTYTSSTFGPSGSATTTGTIRHSPRFGVVGSGTTIGTETTHLRYLVLEAIDVKTLRDEGKVAPTWKTIVTSSGPSGDLRRVMPVLAAAAQRYVAIDTGQQVQIEIREDDPVILSIKRAR